MIRESDYLTNPEDNKEREEKIRKCYECGDEIPNDQEFLSAEKWYRVKYEEICTKCNSEFERDAKEQEEYELMREAEKQTRPKTERTLLSIEQINC